MSTVARPQAGSPAKSRPAETIPFRRLAGPLRRNPLGALTQIVQDRDGAITRLNLGPYRPYLVTRPEHVRYALKQNAENYPRQGLMWDAMHRLVGDNLGGEGPKHRAARQVLQPEFTAQHLEAIYPRWAPAITQAVDDLVARRQPGEAFEVYWEYTAIIHRAANGLFFGGQISEQDAERVGRAVRTATTSLVPRLLVPWMPSWIPIPPWDLRFNRSVRVVDRIIQPLVDVARQGRDAGIASVLAERGRTDRQIRDELVALAVAGSESTAVALSWLPVILAEHPDIEARLYDEIDAVIGTATDTPGLRELDQLTYTKQVLSELLRMYPPGWITPRVSRRDDVIDGVQITGGSYVVISPYLTHRLPSVWPEPDRFDPDRHTAEARKQRREAFPRGVPDLTFGYGHHACLGQQFFELESVLILARLLSQRRLRLRQLPGAPPTRPKPGLALNPDWDVQATLEER